MSLTLISASTNPTALATPAITKIETIGATGLQGFVTTPYLKPGVSKEYWIYGPWLDHADRITLNGVAMTKLGTADKMVKAKLVVPGSTPRGKQTLRITISCWFTIGDCREVTLTRDVMILRSGWVGSVTPNVDITPNQPVTLTISGSNLQNADVIETRSMFKAVSISSRTSTSFKMTGTTSTCGTAVIIVGDEAEGGDVYPYGTLSVKTNATCSYVPPPKIMSSGCPAGQYWDNNTKTCKY
jgi:hypothetical protein